MNTEFNLPINENEKENDKEKIKKLEEELKNLKNDYKNLHICPLCKKNKGRKWWKTLCYNCSNEDCKKRNGIDINSMRENKKINF